MVPLSSWIEWREMPEAIKRICELGVKIILVPGNQNHDDHRHKEKSLSKS
jgi:hypothetical protein